MEAEYKEAKTHLRSPVPSAPHSNNGSDEEGGDREKSSVSDLEMHNVDDVDDELHDFDLI